MILSYRKSIWNNTVYSAPIYNLEPFSGCCGSRFYENSKRLYNSKGIAMYGGKKFTEGEYKLNTVKHVSTPDGDITLIMRTKW